MQISQCYLMEKSPQCITWLCNYMARPWQKVASRPGALCGGLILKPIFHLSYYRPIQSCWHADSMAHPKYWLIFELVEGRRSSQQAHKPKHLKHAFDLFNLYLTCLLVWWYTTAPCAFNCPPGTNKVFWLKVNNNECKSSATLCPYWNNFNCHNQVEKCDWTGTHARCDILLAMCL